MIKTVSTKTVCKPARIGSCNKPVIFSPVYKSRHAGNICISKTVRCSVSSKPVSTLINNDPFKSFVTWKTVCFSNVSMTKEFNSVSYCLVTCTEHPVNIISSVVRESVVSYRTACPVDFNIVVKTIKVTLSSTYHCVSFKIPHHISPTVISVSELPLHFARPPATLSVCSSSASSPLSPSTHQFSEIPSSFSPSLLLPPPLSASLSYHHHHPLHPHNQLSFFHHHYQHHQH